MTITDGREAQGAVALPGGILPDREIARLAGNGGIGGPPLADGQIQPASLDLRLGAAWRIAASFLPSAPCPGPDPARHDAGSLAVEGRLEDLALYPVDLTDGAVLEQGCVYLVRALETFALPGNVEGLVSPKSSTGRLDVMVRAICGSSLFFDRVPAGYHGGLFIEIAPQTFPVRVRRGSRLCQMRFRRTAAASPGPSRRCATEVDGRPADMADPRRAGDGATDMIGVDLDGHHGGPVAWRARRNCGVVDVDRENSLDPLDFWEPVHAAPSRTGGRLVLDPSEFYILVSRETVSVAPDEVAEMIAFDPGLGEFRVHYAGFFDPGFGWSQAGGAGSRAVLEVRARDVPFMIEHGQPIGRLVRESMTAPPDRVYGRHGSHYQGQGLRLSKYFRQPAGLAAGG